MSEQFIAGRITPRGSSLSFVKPPRMTNAELAENLARFTMEGGLREDSGQDKERQSVESTVRDSRPLKAKRPLSLTYSAPITAPDSDDLLQCPWCLGMKHGPDTADGFFSCHVCKGEGCLTRGELEEMEQA